MTPQQYEQYLRRIAGDVRFLSYRAGAPHLIRGGLFLVILLPFLLIIAIGFFIEVGNQLHLIKPLPKPVHPTNERWQPNHQTPKTESTHYR
jgi:hypothetical protein